VSYLELEGITKSYRGVKEPVLKSLDLFVEKGEILVLLGSSGCGKTTTLRVVAGLEQQDGGRVSIDGQSMDGLKPEKRPIAMVFQKSLLFQNMTVAENIGFAPRVNRSMKKKELARRVEEMLELMQLSGLGNKRATQISGGQEQRVSLARALITEPKLLLLDEPLSALDAGLRVTMREHITMLNRTLGTTMLFVTHDQAEAVSLGHRIALMSEGRLVQCTAPDEFYRRPATKGVATFFGWKNFLPATLHEGRADCALGSFEIAGIKAWAAEHGLEGNTVGAWELAIRPESAINLGSGTITGTVDSLTRLGMDIIYHVRVRETALELVLNVRTPFDLGDTLSFDLDTNMIWPVPTPMSDDLSAEGGSSYSHSVIASEAKQSSS
jgi:ABC-type Fe3+/spermidine/putrescine transport system ATPase subunit